MILAEDYAGLLQDIGTEYFIGNVQFVPDLLSWSKKRNLDFHEPHQLMKIVTEGETMTIVIQSEFPENMLDNVINNLSIRWSLKDNVRDPLKILNTEKKRLVFVFLKECARTTKNVGGDELIEDEWAIKAMEKLGFFRE